MTWMVLILACIPLAAAGWIARNRKPDTREWLTRHVPYLLTLATIGAAAAGPFLTTRVVGTGEAYNYTLALADAIEQMRSGTFPPLVGETEYAFNGRVHPLRTAPYLFYLGGALDLVTRHHLTPWQLQNLSLSLTWMACAFSTCFALRRATQCSRVVAVLLTVLYVLSPAWLGITHLLNMFMTVYTAPFVAIALAACVRQERQPDYRNDLTLGLAVGLIWLCHPPVAVWLTGCAVLCRGTVAVRQRTPSSTAGAIVAAAVCAAVSIFVFASVHSLAPEGNWGSVADVSRSGFIATTLTLASEALPKWFLPLTRRDLDQLGSLQLSYVHWGLLCWGLLNVGSIYWARRRAPLVSSQTGLAAAALVLGFVTFPVPVVTRWIWQILPESVLSLTNIWPAQRTVPLLTAVVVVIAAILLRDLRTNSNRRIVLALGIVLAWTVYQSVPFLWFGVGNQRSRQDGEDRFLPENIDLTVTSYSYLGLPPTFVHGPMDPELELQLVDGAGGRIASNYEVARTTSDEVSAGVIAISGPGPSSPPAHTKLRLEPGTKYLIEFKFLTPPTEGTLIISGSTIHRTYHLPEAGRPAGFGMSEKNRHAISLWTSAPAGEEVELWVASNGAALPESKVEKEFARFSLRKIDRSRLPVVLRSLHPLVLETHAPSEGCRVETFRRFSPGYQARVNGRFTRVTTTAANNVSIPVPSGTSQVRLDNRSAAYITCAFAVSAISVSVFGAWICLELAGISLLRTREAGTCRGLKIRNKARWRHPRATIWAAMGGAVAIIVGIAWYSHFSYLREVGPVHLRFYLPENQVGSRQSLFSTGKPGAGTVVFVTYLDSDHMKIGIDVWGTLYESGAVVIHAGQEQDLVADFAALYPLDHPLVAHLPPALQQTLRREIRLELNGRTILAVANTTFESSVNDVYWGGSKIGGSLAEHTFRGELSPAERLPLRLPFVLTESSSVLVDIDSAGIPVGVRQPLFSVSPLPGGGVAYVQQVSTKILRLGFRSSNGEIIETPPLSVPAIDQVRFTLGMKTREGPVFAKIETGGRVLAGSTQQLGPLVRPIAIFPGISRTDGSDVDVRFLGRRLLVRSSDVPKASEKNEIGPLEMDLTLPAVRPAVPEPLLVTGRTGAADFIYVRYRDARHVSFGVDHWGVGGAEGPPIEIDFSVPHRIKISIGSLFPPEEDARWRDTPTELRRKRASTVEISVDGEEVFATVLQTYAAYPNQIFVAENRLGGSSCGTAFSGQIYSTRRLGLVEPRN